MIRILLLITLTPLLSFGSDGFSVAHYTTKHGGERYSRMTGFDGTFKKTKVLFWTNYNYPAGGNSNMTIDSSTFGGGLVAGDSVFIPAYSSGVGWRSQTYRSLNSGTPGAYIHIIWKPGAFIAHNLGSQLQANVLDNCSGIHISTVNMSDNSDVFLRVTNGRYSNWIWIDSCTLVNCNSPIIQIASTLPNMGGDSTKMMHHLHIQNTNIDSSFNQQSAVAMQFGSISQNGFCRDIEIDHCYFDHFYSVAGVPSNYINLLNCVAVNIHHNIFKNLGVVQHPTGHASVVNTECVQLYYHDNVAIGNFADELRALGEADAPFMGSAYTGRWRVYNNTRDSSRKYSLYETRQMSSADSTALAPYMRPRTMGIVYNNTMYLAGVGAGGNTPYSANIIDGYRNDTLDMHNNIVTMVSDTTFGTVYGPFLWSLTVGGSMSYVDTGGNRLVQSWVNSGLADSVRFLPIVKGALFNNGVAAPSYTSPDMYGTKRFNRSGVGVDIGAAQSPVGDQLDRCAGCKIKWQ